MHEFKVIEKEPKSLLGYWLMTFQQTQNAWNDKMAQFILVPLGAILGYSLWGLPVESCAAILISLPYIIFAPIAGWLSDRFSKRNVLLYAAIVQVIILLFLTWSIREHHMGFAMWCFFLLAVQAAFFNPAKVGITKELVGSQRLGYASGMQQMFGMIAMIGGQVIAGKWYDSRFNILQHQPNGEWHAAFIPILIITIGSILSILAAYFIPHVPAHDSPRLTASLFVSHFKNLKALWANRKLGYASLGVAFFWGYAVFINTWSIKLAKVITEGKEGFGSLSSLFMIAASVGMICGFGVASFLLRKKIELGWVPLAALAMVLMSGVMMLIEPDPSHYMPFLIALGFIAFCSAVFLAPLNAWMQDAYPANQRGELQSAVNLQDCLASLLAVGVLEAILKALSYFGIVEIKAYQWSIGIIGLVWLVTAIILIKYLLIEVIRLLAVNLIRFLYRLESTGIEHIPEQGGVLLLPNHMTYADAFYISTACPRKVRFVMDDAFMKYKIIRLFCNLFDTIPISLNQPREAIRSIIKALHSGDVVCVFPEGQLTRTGLLNDLQRGCEIMARQSSATVIPVWMDGLWGSLFSFEQEKFSLKNPYKIPYGLRIAFGKAISSEHFDLKQLQKGMMESSVEALQLIANDARWKRRKLKLELDCHLKQASEQQLISWWVQAHQIGQTIMLRRRQPFAVWYEDMKHAELMPVWIAFADLYQCKLILAKQLSDIPKQGVLIGGEQARLALKKHTHASTCLFYDFSENPAFMDEVMEHLPCATTQGIILSISLKNPIIKPSMLSQLGKYKDSCGKLLPGFSLDSELKLVAPSCFPQNIALQAFYHTEQNWLFRI